MKKILNLDGVKKINKSVQKQIKGGFFVRTFCEPSNPSLCCYDIPGKMFCEPAAYCTSGGECGLH